GGGPDRERQEAGHHWRRMPRDPQPPVSPFRTARAIPRRPVRAAAAPHPGPLARRDRACRWLPRPTPPAAAAESGPPRAPAAFLRAREEWAAEAALAPAAGSTRSRRVRDARRRTPAQR